MALPPEKISELKQIIHTHLSQVNKNVVDAVSVAVVGCLSISFKTKSVELIINNFILTMKYICILFIYKDW